MMSKSKIRSERVQEIVKAQKKAKAIRNMHAVAKANAEASK